MKAISIRQPWAWLIINGHKDIENRSWSTKHRGSLLIHASSMIDQEAMIRARLKGFPLPSTFKIGGIVGIVSLDDCVTKSSSPWYEGQYGFKISNARPLPFHQCKGQLGIFEISDYILPIMSDRQQPSNQTKEDSP